MFESFQQDIATDVCEFLETRHMHRAIQLSQQTGQHFNHNEYPMYFTGRLDARLVLIHLNPKQRNNCSPTYEGEFWLPDVKSYMEYHAHFGQRTHGSNQTRRHKSPFDHKQIRFLQPFGVLPFVEERTPADRLTNLVRVIDEKLQLELIPYGSDTFSAQGFTPQILEPHTTRILNVISAAPRDYVIFCGRIFEDLFRDNITERHTFTLMKKDGTPTKSHARFANLCFTYRGQTIRAGIAASFAQQGIPMGNYGAQCHARYALS